METSTIDPIRLFCYYHSADRQLVGKFIKSLAGMERETPITYSTNHQYTPGSQTAQELQKKLQEADMILLLISATFIADNACYEVMEQALERYYTGKVLVALVLLKPMFWGASRFNILPRLPSTGNTVEDWPSLDRALKDISQGICSLLKKFYVERGDDCYRKEQLEDGRKCYEYALSLDDFEQAIPRDTQMTSGSIWRSNVYLRRGNLLRDMGKNTYAEAMYSFLGAIEANPEDSYAHYCLGSLLFEREDFDQALSSLERAIALKPSLTSAYLYKGFIFEKKGKIAEALNIFHDYLKTHPGDPLISYFAGEIKIRARIRENREKVSYLQYSMTNRFSISSWDYGVHTESPEILILTSIQIIIRRIIELIEDLLKHFRTWLQYLQETASERYQQRQQIPFQDMKIQSALFELLKVEETNTGYQIQLTEKMSTELRELSHMSMLEASDRIMGWIRRWEYDLRSIVQQFAEQQNIAQEFLTILRDREKREALGLNDQRKEPLRGNQAL